MPSYFGHLLEPRLCYFAFKMTANISENSFYSRNSYMAGLQGHEAVCFKPEEGIVSRLEDKNAFFILNF